MELGLDNYVYCHTLNDKVVTAINLDYIIGDYLNIKDYQRAFGYSKQMDSIIRKAKGYDTATLEFLKWKAQYQIARAYSGLKLTDSALLYARNISAFKFSENSDYRIYLGFGMLAEIYNAKDVYDSALFYYRQAIPYFDKAGVVQNEAYLYTGMARLFKTEGRLDSAIVLCTEGIELFSK